MRIVFAIYHLKNGGAEREVVAFANELAKLGEEIHIVCVETETEEYFPDEKVKRHRLTYSSRVKIPKLRGLCNIMISIKRLRELKADVIVSLCLPAHYNTRIWLSTLCSKTYLVYAVRNNSQKECADGKSRRRWKRNCLLADGIWIQMPGQRRFFPPYLLKKVFEAPNLLDQRFLEIPRQKRSTIRQFISVGRIHWQKNQKLLIQAFSLMLLRTEDPYATLTIYGRVQPEDERPKQELEALIQELHLEERVFLPGRVSDIERRYEEADAFVFGSDYEGCPNALMEAMAAGLPCISTDCPTGPSDLITDGKDGLLVPVGDVEAMACAMQRLAENPQEAERLGDAAKQRMKEWGSAREMAERLLENLRGLCFSNKGRG